MVCARARGPGSHTLSGPATYEAAGSRRRLCSVSTCSPMAMEMDLAMEREMRRRWWVVGVEAARGGAGAAVDGAVARAGTGGRLAEAAEEGGSAGVHAAASASATSSCSSCTPWPLGRAPRGCPRRWACCGIYRTHTPFINKGDTTTYTPPSDITHTQPTEHMKSNTSMTRPSQSQPRTLPPWNREGKRVHSAMCGCTPQRGGDASAT